jgi:hypothetical protein
MKYAAIITVPFLLLFFIPAFAYYEPPETAAQNCEPLWQNARAVIGNRCTQSQNDDYICYGNGTLQINPPFSQPFSQPGHTAPLDSSIQQTLTAGPWDELGRWGLAWFKVRTIRETDVAGFLPGQAVVFIVFGDVTITDITGRASRVRNALQAACSAHIRPGSTTFGGSYVRALPDPEFRQECRRGVGSCRDKDNLLRFIPEGESHPLQVLGIRSGRGDTLLVRDTFVTGWITASPRFINHSACDLNSLPGFNDSAIDDALDSPAQLSGYNTFTIRGGTPAGRCGGAYMPSGVLIHNPTHQRVSFTVNRARIEMASTIFIESISGTDAVRVHVLQGQVNISVPGANPLSRPPSTGDVIQVQALGTASVLWRVEDLEGLRGPVRTFLFDPGVCGPLSELVAAAFPGVPPERTNYCLP